MIGWFGLNKNVGYSNTFPLLICFVILYHVFYSFLSVSIVEFEQVNAVQDVFDYVSYIKQVNYKNTERNAKYMFYKTSRFTNFYLSGQFIRQKIILGVLYETFEVQMQELFFFYFQIKGYLRYITIFCHKVALDV